MKDYCGRVPLILKLNGKTNIPDDWDAVSPLSVIAKGSKPFSSG